jgi:hypothetical protein
MAKKPQTQKIATKEAKNSSSRLPYNENLASFREWFGENWKMTLLIFGFTFLVFFMKVHEEMNGSFRGEKSDENLYEVLGLTSQATVKDIKKQYNKLAVEFHPDKHPNCVVCEEKFRKISAAYEVLSSEDSKEHYDQTSGILEPIKSGTTSLYLSNIHKIVYETPYVWIIQVYSEDSSRSQTFSGFWEELAIEHDYINFGRINHMSQTKLVYQLPFAVDELPHVFSIVPGEHSEVLELSYDKSPNADLRNFLRKAIGTHYKIVQAKEVAYMLKNRTLKKKVTLINIDSIPIIYQYMAYRYPEWFEFYSTPTGSHKAVQETVGSEKASIVIASEFKNSNELPNRVFTAPQSKNTIKRVLSYLMSTSLPSKLNRRTKV